MSETVLVTGASSGIGKASAALLLRRGYKVYAGARRLDKMKDLESLGANIMRLDVTDGDSVENAVRTVEEAGRLDILINNAGYGANGAVEDIPLEEARRQFEVNLFGLARLTRLVLPGMRARGAGRIINISSIAGRISMPLSGWYNASKHALEAYSDALRMEAGRYGVKVILIEPGAIRTEWDDTALVNLARYSGSGPYAELAEKFAVRLRGTYRRTAPGPEVVAAAVLRAVRAVRPAARYAVPFQARALLFMKWLLPDRIWDSALRCLLK